MPFVVLLFIIALCVTLLGVFLSSNSLFRRSQNDYHVTTRSRRIVEPMPISVRRRRQISHDTSHEQNIPVRRRASVATVATRIEPGAAERIRAGMYGSRSSITVAEKRAVTKVSGAGISYSHAGRSIGSWRLAIPGLIAIFLLGLYLLNMTLPHPLFWVPVSFGITNVPSVSAASKMPAYAASVHLTRLSQLDPAQYQSMQEYNIWAYSACSAASMTEVINSYNHTYRITDILKAEAGIHEITPQLGLLEEVGIQRTAALFGFKTHWGHNFTLNQVIAAANSGTPVIVSFPPARYAGGHVLVVRGGDGNFVTLADSSRLNWIRISRERFMQLWGGFYAVVTPA